MEIEYSELQSLERRIEKQAEYIVKLERKLVEFEAENGERVVKSGMNRQGRVAGDSHWIDFHAMTFNHVAQTLARAIGDDSCSVEVRDVSEPSLVRQFTVDRREVYQVVAMVQGPRIPVPDANPVLDPSKLPPNTPQIVTK